MSYEYLFNDCMYVKEMEGSELRRLSTQIPQDIPDGTYFCAFDGNGTLRCVTDTLPEAQSFVFRAEKYLQYLH